MAPPRFASKMACVFRGLWSGYRQALVESPYRTKAMTSFVLFGIGSAGAQDLEHRRQRAAALGATNASGSAISAHKVAACSVYGGTLYAPGMHLWYNLLERQLPSAALRATCTKLFFHSTVAAPCIIASFTLTTQILEGQSLTDSCMALQESGPRMWFTALGFINVGLFVNYHFMPLHYRVIFGNLVQLAWTAYQSWELQRAERERSKRGCAELASLPLDPLSRLLRPNWG